MCKYIFIRLLFYSDGILVALASLLNQIARCHAMYTGNQAKQSCAGVMEIGVASDILQSY